LADALDGHAGTIRQAAAAGDYRAAFTGVAALKAPVATFFDEVLVMAEEADVRAARLGLVASLRDLIVGIADISEMATE
jgi:glycyl-tRNA synthetase beta chain